MSKVPTITNAQVPEYVAERKEFKTTTGNLYGVMIGDRHRPQSMYVVYSYGSHHPIYCKTDYVSYVNISEGGYATRKHRALIIEGINNLPYSYVDTQKMRTIMFDKEVATV